MLNALKDILGSKKFWLTVVGSAACGGLTYIGAPHELIAIVAGLFGINAIGQGMADFGKSKSQIENINR